MIPYKIYFQHLALWKARLKRLGITQAEMGTAIGTSRPIINRIINLSYDPKLSLFDAGESFLKEKEDLQKDK